VNYQVHYRVVPSLVSVNEEFVKDLKAKAATFVLITNILEDKELSSADVLRECKNQTAVELSFCLSLDSGLCGWDLRQEPGTGGGYRLRLPDGLTDLCPAAALGPGVRRNLADPQIYFQLSGGHISVDTILIKQRGLCFLLHQI
jgi:hypothetical protein